VGSTGSKLHDIKVVLRAETEKAWQLDVGLPDPIWFPKSQCEYDPSDSTLTLPEWLAIEKGLDNLL
jgi:hypothetical protein